MLSLTTYIVVEVPPILASRWGGGRRGNDFRGHQSQGDVTGRTELPTLHSQDSRSTRFTCKSVCHSVTTCIVIT